MGSICKVRVPDTSDPSATVFINSMVHSVCEITIMM